jgi:hypothetical protein
MIDTFYKINNDNAHQISIANKKKCVAYPQEDFLFIKLITSLRISLLNNCKKDFQFHTEIKFFYTKYKIFFT